MYFRDGMMVTLTVWHMITFVSNIQNETALTSTIKDLCFDIYLSVFHKHKKGQPDLLCAKTVCNLDW